jgi:2,4-dienoyl-CoA reductase-like NADH-dependent reductase (Old Yellow Enzyme family)
MTGAPVTDLAGLFTEIRLGGAVLPNRFVLPGMQRRWALEGAPTPRLGDYYRRRIDGGVGLIITESVAIDHPSSTQNDAYLRINNDTLAGWRDSIHRVKEGGGHLLVQLWHEGAKRVEGGDGPWAVHPTISPSGLEHAGKAAGRALTLAEIVEIREAFVRSARMAQDSGADGVEVHGAHGYLLDQFLWSATNRRDDDYGGDDINNRVRLPAEIIRAVREACGPDFIISFRFSQWKEIDYTARVAETPEELAVLTTAVRDAGADVLHASTRRFWQPEWPGSDLNLAGWARQLSGLPTITVGSVGLNNTVSDSFKGEESESQVEEGVRLLAERFALGEFDMVSVGRSLISDAEWVTKVREGRFDEIRSFSRTDLRRPDDYSD